MQNMQMLHVTWLYYGTEENSSLQFSSQVTIDVRLHMYIIIKIIVFASDDAGPSSETSITSTDATA